MATEAVIIQEPVPMVEKMATEAVIIQEPISMVEKMATEAVIIAEPISMVKTEEESKHLTLDVGASNNGVETTNVVAEGNHGITKGESFLMSPEISKVANETCGVLDHTEVDGTPFKAEKIPEDEEKVVVRIEEEAGTRGIRKGDAVDGSDELEKQASMDSHYPTLESLKDAKETVTEASSTDRISEVDDTKKGKLPAEAGKDGIILDSLGETLTETLAESKEIACMDEKPEQVSSEEIKCKNSVLKTEELHLQAPGFGTENTVEDYSTKDVDTTISGEIAEGSASIEDTTSVKDHEERSDENEKTETVEVEISNKNADDSHVTDSAGQPVGNEHEKTREFSGMQPKEQVYEAISASENKEEESEDVPKACQSRDSTKPEHIFTEAAATIDLKSETSRSVKEDLEDCTAETMNEKSEEENTAATMSTKEVCKEHEAEASGIVKENPETKEYPIANIPNSSITDETVKGSMKEGESRPMKSTEEVSNSNIEEADSIEETEKPDNDPSPFNVKETKEEIIPIEVKEDHVHSSLIELEDSRKDTEEETNVNKDEAEGEKKEIHNVVTVEEIGVATEHEEIDVNRANIDVKSMDSPVTCDKNVEIPEPEKEDGMQDEIPNAGSDDHIELANKEIQLKEAPEDEVKEHSTVPSEEYETTPIEERKITDETSEKDQDLDEHLEEVAVGVKVVLDTTDKEPPVVMEVLDDMKRDEESTVPTPEGSIIKAENVNLVWQSEEEKSKEEIQESFQKKNEPEKEKPVSPLNVVSEDVNTTNYGETVETRTNIEEATAIKNLEERSKEEGREDSPTDHLRIEVNENTETVKAEISNKNADDVNVADSSTEPVKNEHEFSDVQPNERVREAIGASKEKKEDSEDVSKAYQSRDGTNPEAETITDLKPKTSEMENENPEFVKEVDLLDSKNVPENLEALENKQEGIQQELEDCTADATQNIDEIHDSPKLIVKEECAIIDDSLKSTEEGEKEEIPEVKVCEKLETDNTVENTEKQIIQEEDNKDQTALKELCKGSETAASCTAKEEINLIEVKEELVHSSSFEREESEENTEKETSVIITADLDCTSNVAETEETKIEEAETDTDGKEERNEINNERISVESADIDVKSADSCVTSEKDMEIPREEDGMQDRIPNQGRENQMEMPTEEIQSKEVVGDEKEEPSIMPLEEFDATLIDETSEKEQALYKHLENVRDDVEVVQATDKELAITKGSAEMRKDEESVVSVSQTAETSTIIKEATSINDHEERPEGERREEPPTDHLQIEANESYENVQVEVSNEAVDDLHVTDSFIGHEKQNEISDVQPVENEALEHKEEDILQELEDSSAEKPEPKDAVENVEENLKQKENNEVQEGPTLIVKEDCAITDDSLKSTEEDENEETPEVEVCEKLELDNTVEIDEKQILDEEDNKGQTTLMADMMKEKDKEENTAAMVSMTEASNSVIEEMDSKEETAKPNNNPNQFDVVKDSGELTTIEVKEDQVCSSSFELEESKNDTEEGTPESCAAEAEETNIKGAEVEEEKNERNNVVVVEERAPETTQLEGIAVYSAEMNVKPPTEDTEISRDIDAIQDEVPNAGSGDQLEMNSEEIPSKEISDKTSEKDQYLYEHSEIPTSQATDEKLMQNEDSPQSDVSKAEPEDIGNESRHEVKEQLVEEPNVEVTNVSTEEVKSEQDNQTDASEAKTLQDEKSLDLGLKPEQNEDGKPLDEATDLGDTVGTSNDDEKVVKEENLAKNLEETESLKEDREIGKDQIPGVVIVNDNAKVEDFNSVSNECLNEAESKQKTVAENLEVEEDSTIEGEASHAMKELEETRQEEESGGLVYVHSEDLEAEKKPEEIIHDPKQGHEESCIEAVTEVRADTSSNETDENSKALNISSVEMNPEIVESDANQETEVENVQLEEMSSGLDLDVRTNDNDDAQKQNLNAETLDRDEAEVINRAPDAGYMPEVQIDETEKGPIAETADELNKDIELGETKSEASKTSNADELGKLEDIGPPNTVLEVKPEEQIQTSIGTLLSEDEEIRIENPVEKIEEATQKESQEGSSETKTTEEVCLSNEEQKELKAVSEEGTIADQDPQKDEPDKPIQTAPSTMPSEEEVQTKLEDATGDELTGEQTTSLLLVSRGKDEENICRFEKTEEEEEKINEADMIPDKISEGFSVAETTTEPCLEKEELLELDDAKKDGAEKEDEKIKEEETIKDEIEEDAKDAKTRSEIYSKTERSVELETVREDETTAVETLAEKISDAQVLNVATALPSKEDESENTITAEMIGSEKASDEDASLQKDQLQEDEAVAVDDDASSQVILIKKPDDLPESVDTLPTDHLHPTTSTLPSEVEGDEKKEIELEKEEESPEKIPEQTHEIEEAPDFNTEINEKAFKNELHDETEDVSIQEKLVKATAEAGEIRLDEVSAEKMIAETQKTSESRAVIEENVVLASFEEKPESESAPVAKDQSEETLPESNKGQDDETSIDAQNQETEEQMKEEPMDKLEDEHIINREENTNEIKTTILSEEVDKEVVKAEGSEDFKEYVIEKESSTNKIHQLPNGDETINKVEDYSADSTECNQEAKYEEEIQSEKSEVEENLIYEKESSTVKKELDVAEKGLITVTVDELNGDHELGETESEASKISNADELGKIDDICPPNTVLEVKPEAQIQTSVCTLLSEDEEIRIGTLVEKIEEETQDTKIEHEIRENSSETKTIEEVCLSNEEKRELKAVSEEETIADQDPQNDEPEERIQTASSALPSEESEHGTGAIIEEIKYDLTKEEVQTKLDAATGDEVTGEQTPSPVLVSSEKDEESICTVEKIEEEKIIEADMVPDKISEGISVAETRFQKNVVLESFEEKPKSEYAPLAEDRSEETFFESSKSQDDETSIEVQNQETQEQINEELKEKLEDEHIIIREQNTNETKVVILSEEVDKGVEKAEGSEGIKEYVMEKESSTNEIHPEPNGDEVINEAEDFSAVSTECKQEAKSEEQIQAENSKVEENSINEKEGSPVMKELDEGRQDKESGDSVNALDEDKEAKGKDEVIDDLKPDHDMSHGEAVTVERAETSLNGTEVNEERVNTLDISSVKMGLENSESNASQEIEEVEKVQLEEISSSLAPEVPTNNDDEVEANKRDADEVYIAKDSSEAENGLSVARVDQLNQHEFVETKSEASEKSLTTEPEANKVEETEGALETSSNHTSPGIEIILKDEDGSTNTFSGEKSEEELQSSTSTLLCEDEEIRTARSIGKIEEEIQNDAGIEHESREESSCTNSVEEACLLNEEQRELKAVSAEETTADKGLPNDEPEAVLDSEPNTSRVIADESEERGATETSYSTSHSEELMKDSYGEDELKENLMEGETHEELKTSEIEIIENQIKDKTIEVTGQASVAKIETTAVIEENVVLAGLEEKPESESALIMVEEQKETFPEFSKSQDDETGIDAENQETEEQIKEELKDEHIINREQNKNETKADILSEEVDKEVEKAKGSEDIKEYVVEEESGTNEIHPVPSGDEAINEVEDFSAVSTECIQEAKSEEQIQAENSEVEENLTNEKEGSLVMKELDEGEQNKESEVALNVHGEDREAEEKDEVISDLKLSHDMSHSEAVTAERAETSLNDTEVNDEPEAVLESETNTSRVIAEESEEHGDTKEKRRKEAESFEDEEILQSECTREIQVASENSATAVYILPGETSADNLHATASTLPSEVKENETMETELKEDEIPEKIVEQTGEIKEALNLNKETCEKPFELLSETDDAAKDITRDETEGEGNKCEKTEGNEITANEDSKEEVMEDKEVIETSYSTSHSEEPVKDGYAEDGLKEKIKEDETHEELKTSEIEILENQTEDKTIEDPAQSSVAKIETTAVTEEDVAKAGFEEKPKSETEPVIEDQCNEIIPEDTKSQGDGTSLHFPDQETEEQIKEELKEKLEEEDSINREENVNEVTKAVILSEEVDKEVEKADGGDDIKEQFMEKESSTTEIHPVSNRDEATNEVEDYVAVSTSIQEVKSEEQIQAKNSEVEENSTNDKEGSHIPKELDERKQEEKSVDPVNVHNEDREVEKVEIIDDLKLGHGKSHTEAVTEERAETSLNDTEMNKELVNTSNINSGNKSLENIGIDANQEIEEAEKVQLEEVSSDLASEVPSNNNDEVEIIKRDLNEFYTAKDQNAEAENDLTVQKVDQLNQDHELTETKTEASKKSLTAELEANEVEETEAVPETFSDHTSQTVETILKDDDSSMDTFPEEKSAEQLQSSTCTLFSEDEDTRTASPIEKIEEEMQNDAEIKHNNGKDSLDTKIREEVLHQEDEALAEDNINNASAPNILSEKPEQQIQNPAVTLPSEEHKHKAINEVEKTGEMKNGDSHREEAIEKKSTEKDETREPEETLEGETNTCMVIPEELEEHGTVIEEMKRKEAESFEDEKSTQSECTRELQGALEDGAAAVHILPGETSAVNVPPAASTLPSEVSGNETKETERQEDENPKKIQEQTREIEEVSNFNIETCGRAFDNELLTKTEDAANEKKIVITNEIEVLKAEVTEDKEVTETSYSTSHLEETIKDGSGEDELKDKLIQDNKLVVEEEKTENEIVENQIEVDHASVSRIDTIAVTEENVEPAPPSFEEKPESNLGPVAEDQSKETLPGHTKSQDDKTRTDVFVPWTEEQIKEELKDKVEAEGSINGEQNKNEVTKAVILSEEADGSEDIKEHVIEEESSQLHPVSKGDETINEVEDCSAVSFESIEAAGSQEQIQESRDPVNVHGEDREAGEKVEIANDLQLNHDKSHSEAVAEERAETRLNDAEVNEKLENTSNISTVKMSSETIESDINQETEEAQKVQLEEVSSDLAPEVPSNNNEEAEVTERDPDAFCMSKDQITEAENAPTAELEGDKVEIEGVPEQSSDNVAPRVETVLKVDSTSTNTFLEEKPEEQLQSSARTLLSIPNEEQRELKAVSGEKTIADKVPPKDKPEEQIQTTSLTFLSVEREHGAGAIIEEIEHGKTKEEVPINQDVTGDEITGKQTHETNKLEEITSSPLVSMEKEANVSSVEQIEEEKLSDAETPENISENPFDAKKTAETCLENEAISELDDAKKDTQALQMQESNEQFFTSELPVENLKHRTEANDEEEVKEEEMLENEGPREPEAVIDQEFVVARASITEESQKIETISIVETLDEQKRTEAVKVVEENCEDSSAGETKELNDFHLVTKEETTSYLAFSEEQLHIISASAITSEESEHETKEKEDEKTSEGEIIKYEIEEDASDAKATVEIRSQKGSSVEVEAVAEDEMAASDEAEKTESKKIEEAELLQHDSGKDATLQKELLQGGEALVAENNASLQTIPKEKPEEQIPNLVVTLPSEEHKHNTISEVDETKEEKIKEEEIKIGDSEGVKTVQEVSTEKDQTKGAVAVLDEHESLEKIQEQTGDVAASSDINMEKNEKPLNSELLDETEDAAIKENIGKAIDESGGEANQSEKINEGNEIILYEVSKEEVTSHSTFQSEEPTRDGEDALKDELIEDKTYKEFIGEAQKTSESKITEKQIKDEVVVKNPGQDSAVRVETSTVTEDHIENMGITSSFVEEYVLIDLQERVVECSQKAEVRVVKETYPEVVEHGVEKTVDKSVEDSTKISSSDGVESLKETEDEKMSEVKITKEQTEEDSSDTRTALEICSQVDTSIMLETVTENEMTSNQTLTAKKSEEQMQNPTSAPHSKEERCIRASVAEEIESEKMEEVEFLQDDNKDVTFQKEQLQGDEALAVENIASLQTIPAEKSEEQIPNPIVTLSSEEHKHETVNEVDKPEEENTKKEEMKNRDFDGRETVEELSTGKDETKGAAHVSEGEINHLHIIGSALPSDVQGDETNKTESKENESLKKIPEQTGEIEEASNFTPEIHEKASDNETKDAAIKENVVKVSDGFTQTNEGKEIILNEVSKEEIISYSTPHSEELTKDDSQEDAVKDERIEDKTYEELIVEAEKTSENKMNEKQIECGVVEEEGQASVVRIETTTESSSEFSMAEGNQILEYIQQTGETTKTASDIQIPRELDHIENKGITSLVAKENVPVDFQDRVAGPSQKAEVRDVKEIYLECGGEITADCTGEEVTKESISTQDSIKISSDNVKGFAKEASQVSQDMIEGGTKDETNISQILQAEKSKKQSLAPVDAVEEEEELKELETRDKSISDTKTGGGICLEKEENKQPKAVVVQETIVTQAPQIKDPVSHFKDEHAGDETNETFKVPTYEIQNEKPFVGTQKDDANDNIRQETVAEDKTAKDDMNEASIVREKIPGKEDTIESKKTTNSTGKQQFPTQQQDEAFETSDKAVVGDLEPGTAQEIRSEAGVASRKGEKPDNSGAEKTEESESADSAKLSFLDLLQKSIRETVQGTKNVIEERELKVSNEEPPEEEAKTDEEDGGDENSKTESGIKPHKKSHNILSGMGSKVKHSISKMKKAITGKSSHSKEPKPTSPKESKK